MNATLEIDILGFGERCITLDCRHGAASIHAVNVGGVDEGVLIAVAVSKHYAVGACDCTRELRQKYPPTMIPPTPRMGAGS